MEAALGDVARWIEADLDFHEAVAASSGNRLLDFQIRGLRPVIREVMEIFNSREARTAADWRKTYERHVRVVEAIRTGDPQAATLAMNKHFEAAEAAIAELATSREDSNDHEDRTGS
jgi:GntR family transcriptional repressor for pyruvate dehydrogenase complex